MVFIDQHIIWGQVPTMELVRNEESYVGLVMRNEGQPSILTASGIIIDLRSKKLRIVRN